MSKFIFILLTSLFTQVNGAQCSPDISLEKENASNLQIDEKSEWFYTQTKPVGVILLIHGLNLKPSKMNPLALHFQESGYDVLRVALAGHRGSLKEQENVTSGLWLKQMKNHICLAQKRSEELGKAPLYLSAFSLGSLVAMASTASSQQQVFKAQLLLAPAAFAHWYGSLTKTLFFLDDSYGIPSKNLKQYRSQKSTSLASYRAMNELREMVESNPKEVHNIDTLVMVDPDDELVSLKKVEEFKSEFKLSQWRIFSITNSKPLLKKSFHHLIIDEHSLGKRYWEELKARSIRLFGP